MDTSTASSMRTGVIALARLHPWDWYRNYLALDDQNIPQLRSRGYLGYGVKDDENLLRVALKIAQTIRASHASIRHDHEYAQALDNILGRIIVITSEDSRSLINTARFIAQVAKTSFGVMHQADVNPKIITSVETLCAIRPFNTQHAYFYLNAEGAPECGVRPPDMSDDQYQSKLLKVIVALTQHLWESCDHIKGEHEKKLKNVISDLKHLVDGQPDTAFKEAVLYLSDQVREYANNHSLDLVRTAQSLTEWETELKMKAATHTPFKAAILELARNECWDWKKNYLRGGGLPHLSDRKILPEKFETPSSALLEVVSGLSHQIKACSKQIREDFEHTAALESVFSTILSIVERDSSMLASRPIIKSAISACREALHIPQNSDIESELADASFQAQLAALEEKRQYLIGREQQLKSQHSTKV